MLMLFVNLAEDNTALSNYKADATLAFKTYADTVFRIAFLRAGNTADADDIMAEVFLRLIKNLHKIKSEEHLKAWLIRATINRSNSFFKKQGRINQVRIVESDAVYEMEENSVLPFVMALPMHQKTVVYMHYFEGYSVDEIANLCGIARGTVKSRLSRARDTLKSTLKGEF